MGLRTFLSLKKGPRRETFLINGQTFSLDIPPPSKKFDRVFSFSLHKAGSVLLNEMLSKLALSAGVPSIDISSALWRDGHRELSDLKDILRDVFARDGYVFLGFRSVSPILADAALDNRHKVLLVRDPRDMLTSFYFSLKYSHAVPEAGETRERMLNQKKYTEQTDIDAFVLSDNVRTLLDNYRTYIARAKDKTWRIYRYEDVVFAKSEWLADMGKHLGLIASKGVIENIAQQHDVVPQDESPYAHIRQVHPGNHRKHLRPTTIEQLNETLADILLHFGYLPNQCAQAPIFKPR